MKLRFSPKSTMTRLLRGATVALSCTSLSAFASTQPPSSKAVPVGRVGLGLGLSGGLNGLSAFYQSSEQNFVQGLLSFGWPYGFGLNADLAFLIPRTAGSDPVFRFYYGIGATILQSNAIVMWAYDRNGFVTTRTLAVGARVPLGSYLIIPTTPVQLSLEVAPGLLFVPSTWAFVDATLAIRYLF